MVTGFYGGPSRGPLGRLAGAVAGGLSGQPRRWLLFAGALLLAGAMAALAGKAIFGWTLFGASGPDPASNAAALTPRGVDATVGGSGSPEYNQMIEELNRAGAESARRSGESFVATPTGDPRGVREDGGGGDAIRGDSLRPAPAAPAAGAGRPEVRMPPQPEGRPVPARREAPRAASSARPDRPAPEDPLGRALAADLKALVPAAPGGWSVQTPEGPPRARAPEPAPEAASGWTPPAPGELMYAVTEVAVDSDVDGPVSAVVVEGPRKGSRLMGGFSLRGERLAISFTAMIPPGGPPGAVSAVAVDPRTSSPAIAGRVDRHLLERWGALMAASFLEGLGEAMANRGTTVRAYGDVLVTDRGAVSMEDVSIEALGRVGSRAAGQLERGFDRRPTVTLPAGFPVGILVTGAGRDGSLGGASDGSFGAASGGHYGGASGGYYGAASGGPSGAASGGRYGGASGR